MPSSKHMNHIYILFRKSIIVKHSCHQYLQLLIKCCLKQTIIIASTKKKKNQPNNQSLFFYFTWNIFFLNNFYFFQSSSVLNCRVLFAFFFNFKCALSLSFWTLEYAGRFTSVNFVASTFIFLFLSSRERKGSWNFFFQFRMCVCRVR